MKYRIAAAIAAAGLCAALPSRAQGVNGWLDVASQQSAVGWACIPGDPNTKVTIELRAYDTAAGTWTSMGTTTADKQRADVGRAGVCGTGPESYYHGFEFPIYPYSILLGSRNWSVYAYSTDTGQALNNGGRPISYPAGSLPTSGYWRTDYEDRNARSPSLVACNWPYHGANLRALNAPDPAWIGGAGPTWPNGMPNGGNLGYQTAPPNNYYCINYDPVSPPPAWAVANSGTNAPSWPTSNYWMVHANYEPAYVQWAGSGPPGQSQPVSSNVAGAGMYALQQVAGGMRMRIDNSRKPANRGAPFLSFGAQMGRGTAGPLAIFDPTVAETTLQFKVTKNADTSPGYHQMGVFIEAIWEGRKRWAWIVLQSRPGDSQALLLHWNWNVYESAFYPGAEIKWLPAGLIQANCNIATIPQLQTTGPNVTTTYSIPIGKVFGCADSNGGWSNARWWYVPLIITGIHFAMELPDSVDGTTMEDRSSVLDATYTDIQLLPY